jgi:hypothetical protein
MAECFAGDKDDIPRSYMLTHIQIHTDQQNDEALEDYIDKHLAAYCTETFKHGTKSYDLYTKDRKIVIPQTLQKKAVNLSRASDASRQDPDRAHNGSTFYMGGKRKTVVEVCKKCKQCQLSKLCKLGKLPPKEPEVIPWETV